MGKLVALGGLGAEAVARYQSLAVATLVGGEAAAGDGDTLLLSGAPGLAGGAVTLASHAVVAGRTVVLVGEAGLSLGAPAGPGVESLTVTTIVGSLAAEGSGYAAGFFRTESRPLVTNWV